MKLPLPRFYCQDIRVLKYTVTKIHNGITTILAIGFTTVGC